MKERLLTTREVAELLAVSEEFVREHAAEIGGIRLTDSNRSPLRFESKRIDEWKDRRRLEPPPTLRPRRRPGPRRVPRGVKLIPLPQEVHDKT